MANGDDKNLIRLCAAIDGFRSRFKRWPVRVLLDQRCIDDLRTHVLSESHFERVASLITLVPTQRGTFTAMDNTGASYDYGAEGPPHEPPDERAYDWFGLTGR